MAKLLACWMTVGLFLLGCEGPGEKPPPAPSSPVVKHMTVDGVDLKYVEQGEGVPVLFVHGSHTDHRLWEPQRGAVAGKYRFIALDQRYFGAAPFPDKGEKFSLATHVGDLAAFIRGLGAGPVHLVGWSYSGTSLPTLLVQHPELVKSLFVFEPSLGTWVTDPADLKTVGEDIQAIAGPVVGAVQSGDNAAAVKLFVDQAAGQEGTFDALRPEVRTMMLENARMLPLLFTAPPPPPVTCEQLGQVKVPVAIARGELSRPLFRVLADTASRCIPGSKLIVVPGARHPWPMQEPAAFTEAVMDFLEGTDA